MTKIQYFLYTLSNAFNFSGRASFDEFISFVVIYLFWGLFSFVFNLFFSFSYIELNLGLIGIIIYFSYLAFICYCLIALISLLIRRVHDTGKGFIYVFIPFYNFFLLMQDGEKNENKFGKIPV